MRKATKKRKRILCNPIQNRSQKLFATHTRLGQKKKMSENETKKRNKKRTRKESQDVDDEPPPGSFLDLASAVAQSPVASVTFVLLTWFVLSILIHPEALRSVPVSSSAHSTNVVWEEIPVLNTTDLAFLSSQSGSVPLPFVVMFYAPWCGHCKKAKPDYVEFANKVDPSEVNVYRVDADADPQLSKRFGVKGFPTIIAVDSPCVLLRHVDSETPDKLVDKSTLITYKGTREADDLVEWAHETFAGHNPEEGEDYVFQGTEKEAWLFQHCILRSVPSPSSLVYKEGKGPMVRLLTPSGQELVEKPFHTMGDLSKMNKEHIAWGVFHKVRSPTSLAVMHKSQLPILVLPEKTFAIPDSSAFVEGHVLFYEPDMMENGARERFYCGDDDPCVRLVIPKKETLRLYGRPLEPEEIGDATEIFAVLKSEYDANELPEFKDDPDTVVASGKGISPAEWTRGTLAQIDANTAGAWLAALETGEIEGLILAYMQQTCSHCHRFRPVLDEVSVAIADMDIPFAVAEFDLSENGLVDFFGEHPTATPDVRYVSQKDGVIVSSKITGARTAADVLRRAGFPAPKPQASPAPDSKSDL